jgi:hypothetical protein
MTFDPKSFERVDPDQIFEDLFKVLSGFPLLLCDKDRLEYAVAIGSLKKKLEGMFDGSTRATTMAMMSELYKTTANLLIKYAVPPQST